MSVLVCVMRRRPPSRTRSSSSPASDVYKVKAQYHNALASSLGGAINQAFKRHKIDFTVPIERGRQHKVDTIQTSVGGQFVLHVVSADTFMGINW